MAPLLGLPLLLALFALSATAGAEQMCRHSNGISYRNGNEWEERGAFIMRCTVFPNNSWKTEVVACVLPGTGRRIAINRTAIEGNDEWRCEMNANGMVSLVQGTNPHATCDGRAVGSRWQEKSFELECRPGGYRRLLACVTESGQRIPVNATQEVDGFVMACQQYGNGTVVFHGAKNLKPEYKPYGTTPSGNAYSTSKCVDEHGYQRNTGDHWVEQRFNKTCRSNGAVEVVNCISKDGYRIPLNGQIIRDGSKFSCEMTNQGTIRFATGPIDN